MTLFTSHGSLGSLMLKTGEINDKRYVIKTKISDWKSCYSRLTVIWLRNACFKCRRFAVTLWIEEFLIYICEWLAKCVVISINRIQLGTFKQNIDLIGSRYTGSQIATRFDLFNDIFFTHFVVFPGSFPVLDKQKTLTMNERPCNGHRAIWHTLMAIFASCKSLRDLILKTVNGGQKLCYKNLDIRLKIVLF